jgi:predicted ATP-binding protein involved in virulence
MERYIRRVRVEGMFDSELEMVVDFSPADNCIFGINGSGKTVLINLIVASIQCDIEMLSKLPFKSIRIVTAPVGGKKESNFLTVEKTSYGAVYNFHESMNLDIKVRLGRELLSNISVDKDKSYKIYNRQARSEENSKRRIMLKRLIAQFIPFTYIPLLRMQDNVGRSDDILQYEMRRQHMSDREISEVLDPNMRVLKKLQEEFSSRYSMAQSKIASALEKLKTTIFEKLLFEDSGMSESAEKYVSNLISTRNLNDTKSAKEVISQIKDLDLGIPEFKVVKHFEIWDGMKELLLSTLDKYHEKDKETGEFSEEKFKKYSGAYHNLIASVRQFKTFDEVIGLIDDVQSRKGKLLMHFNNFKREVNYFLPETKTFEFSGSGQFILRNNNNKLDLIDLSSGEKHILAILGRVCLSSFSGSSVFIADEPELSLHLEWQRQILPSIRRLSPNTQVIVATHAPAIISDDALKINLRKCYKDG